MDGWLTSGLHGWAGKLAVWVGGWLDCKLVGFTDGLASWLAGCMDGWVGGRIVN